MTWTEIFGFVTGALCVWLAVKENVWNWPIGIVSSAVYIVVFGQSRLFADAGLQVVYVIFGALGWFWWLRGGTNASRLPVSRVDRPTALTLTLLVPCAVWGMTIYLAHVKDSAPFLDALTTVLSLAAQYLLTRKLLENWYVWLAADVIYVGLYASRHLYLTALLYALYLLMCVAGLRAWRRSLHSASAVVPLPPAMPPEGVWPPPPTQDRDA